jgi:hypothetical protein
VASRFAWSPASDVARDPLPLTPQRAKRVRLDRRIDRVRRRRWLRRIIVGLFVTTVIAAGAVVTYPALLDPACDDYEWFGADAALVVREYAQGAHDAIAGFVAERL